MFFWNSCFFHDPADVDNLTSGSSAFSKTSLNFWKFMVHVLLKPGVENFECYFTSVWDECNCAVVWAFFGIVFFWDWNENWPFPVLWPLLNFPNLLAYWVFSLNIMSFSLSLSYCCTCSKNIPLSLLLSSIKILFFRWIKIIDSVKV